MVDLNQVWALYEEIKEGVDAFNEDMATRGIDARAGYPAFSINMVTLTKESKVVDNQHQKIKGYRDLSEEEIALMNRIKSMAEEVGALVTEVQKAGTESPGHEPIAIDGRWASIAKTDLQTGFMALVRSVARPETF